MYKLRFFFLFISLLAITLPEISNARLRADTSSIDTRTRLIQLINTQSYGLVDELVRDELGNSITVSDLEYISESLRFIPLQHALKALKSISSLNMSLNMSEKELLRVAFFIETDFKTDIIQKNYQRDLNSISIPCSVEYVSKCNKILIHPNDARIDKGWWKIVYKAILYDLEDPKPVAVGVISKGKCNHLPMIKHELEFMNLLKNQEGIIEWYSIYKRHATSEQVFLEKLYRGGCLEAVLGSGNYKFTFNEKMKLISDFIKGLHSMHKNNIMHADLHAKNLLVDISIKDGIRKVGGVVTDFGNSFYFHSHNTMPPRKKGVFSAPEEFYWHEITQSDFHSLDIYKLGCSLYCLFYETAPPWCKVDFLDILNNKKRTQDVEFKKQEAMKKLMREIEQDILPRRTRIYNRMKKNMVTLGEKVEYLILQMVDPNPKKRGNSKILLDEIAAIEAQAVQ